MSWEESALIEELTNNREEKSVQLIEPIEDDLIKLSPGKIISKVWGIEKYVVNEEDYVAKILIINPGCSTSMHFHKEKKEHIYVLSGEFRVVTINLLDKPGKKEEHIISVGDVFIAEKTEFHQIKGVRPGQLLEISNRLDEGDTYRLERSR